MDDKKEITHNLSRLHRRINLACKKEGRDPQDVRLLLATKTISAEKIKMALETGETLIGENKVQKFKKKFEALKTHPHEKHFIGHLQSNKVKEVLKYVSCVQSLDRLKLARKT